MDASRSVSGMVPQVSATARAGWMRGMGLVLGLIATVFVIYFGVGAYVATQLTHPVRHPQRATPDRYNLDFEEVQFQARDGLRLAAWFIPAETSDQVVVLVHGKDSCRSCEFDGRYLELAKALQTAGLNVLTIELRGHGESEGQNFTLGMHERWDVLGAVDWLHGQGFTKIGVLGVSLGGASTVMAATDPEGGDAIKAVVVDSVFGNLPEILAEEFPRVSGLPTQFLPGSLLMTRLFFGADLNAIRPAERVGALKVPLFVIYSRGDKLVPTAQFEAMVAAQPNATVWAIDSSDHARIYNAFPQEYSDRVIRFFQAALQ